MVGSLTVTVASKRVAEAFNAGDNRLISPRANIVTGRFGTSMSARHILGLEKVPKVRLFAD